MKILIFIREFTKKSELTIIVKDLIHELKHQSLKHSHRDETNLQNYVQLQQRLTIEATIQSLIENLAKDQINTLKYRIRLE